MITNYNEINDMTRKQINAYLRKIDDSNKWPICGKFNATDRAINRVRRFEKRNGEKLQGLEYYLAIENQIIDIVNKY